METRDIETMTIEELRTELKNARAEIAELKRDNASLQAALEQSRKSNTTPCSATSVSSHDSEGKEITIVAVGDESLKSAEQVSQQLQKAIPTMENTVIACDETNAHDVLWSLDAGVQYVIVIWPEDIASGTCGINAINSTSEGLLPIISIFIVFILFVCLMIPLFDYRVPTNICCGYSQFHTEEE